AAARRKRLLAQAFFRHLIPHEGAPAPSYSPCKMQPSCFKQTFFDKLSGRALGRSRFPVSKQLRATLHPGTACNDQYQQDGQQGNAQAQNGYQYQQGANNNGRHQNGVQGQGAGSMRSGAGAGESGRCLTGRRGTGHHRHRRKSIAHHIPHSFSVFACRLLLRLILAAQSGKVNSESACEITGKGRKTRNNST
ncbi:hypothetical protein, partial [Dysosmobacter sp.]|uniref:hypothetical protein n=1 Tax=Dysosmobacter sp. TaxID=2591382 RepID=UPI002A8D8E72